MNREVLKFPPHIERREHVWCEPLKLYFPAVYRLVKKKGALSSAAPGFKLNETAIACEFALLDVEDDTQGIANAIPVRHLSPSDNHSLVIRHHWSKSHASAYLQGIEDMNPRYLCSRIYEAEQAIFTIAKCETRKSWPGPMIFYLADLFEDDSEFGVQIWEKSIGVDGELRTTDIFYEDD
jgi:hypothetical protein